MEKVLKDGRKIIITPELPIEFFSDPLLSTFFIKFGEILDEPISSCSMVKIYSPEVSINGFSLPSLTLDSNFIKQVFTEGTDYEIIDNQFVFYIEYFKSPNHSSGFSFFNKIIDFFNH